MKQNKTKRIIRRGVHYLTFYLSFMLFFEVNKSEQFQNKVIDFIGERLGVHAYTSFEGCNQKTQLNSEQAYGEEDTNTKKGTDDQWEGDFYGTV